MAEMLEDLHLKPGQRVLEIGSGTGYNAALIAHLVGSLVSIDVDDNILEGARRHLAAFPDRQVELHRADGRGGYPPAAPFDRILVTAATPDLEPSWLEQLADGGELLAPLDVAPGLSYLVQGTVREGCFDGRLTRAAYFMPLRDERESESFSSENADVVPSPERLAAVPAPWANWEERRPGRRDFLPGLAFLGWVEGLALAHSTLPDGRPGYGLADLVKGTACWFGAREWRVSGKEGRALGDRLWRTFLDAGGPRPTEFRLRATPHGSTPSETATAKLGGHRQGRRCVQVWELLEPRERGDEW
jgi:protein-L-isoaspartate O-methyltransferase